MISPRIQGRVGKITDPEELAGKWTFQIFVSDLGDGEGLLELSSTYLFSTEEEAQIELKKAVRQIVESLELRMKGEISGKVVDLKANSVKTWAELENLH